MDPPATVFASFPAALEAYANDRGATLFASVWSTRKGVERRLTFREFAVAVASGAACFEQLGVKEGERCAFLAKGTLDFYVAVVSLQSLGLTPVFLNWRQPTATLAEMIDDAQASWLVVGAPYHDAVSNLEAVVQRVVSIDGVSSGARAQWTWSLKPGRRASLPARNTKPQRRVDVEAAVFYTSGSTSRPKPVLHTNQTLLWTAENFVFPTSAMTTTLCFMPNFHVLMCFQNFLLPLARGIGVSIHGADATDTITSQLLLSAAAALGPTTIDTVPFIMSEWSTMDPEDLRPLATCAAVRSGGAPLSAAVAERLIDAGIRVQSHYGQTEAPGMQLLTVPRAAADELAIFQPPWTCVEIKLAGSSADEGELLIKGCGGSSPGYLKAGALVAGSSRVDAHGWHHTGDVFRRVTTRSGAVGLKHVSRVDDTVLLSTGEMFNPTPIEATIEDYATRHDLRVTRLVVLGKEHAAPFLVVEPADAKNPGEFLERLWPGVDAANATQVEYARIKRGHVLILVEESLPHSAKGNVIRARAETMFAERLKQVADDAVAEAVDWNVLRRKAFEAGFGDDVDAYLADKGTNADDLALIGVDSLGLRTLTNRGAIEAERIGDNVKAWTVTAIVICHWYTQVWLEKGAMGAGALAPVYEASCGSKYTEMSWLVQYSVGSLGFSSSIFTDQGATPAITLLMFAVGLTDAARDGSDRLVKFTKREPSLVCLIILLKLVINVWGVWSYLASPKLRCVRAHAPYNLVGFFYFLLYYRVVTWAFQRLPVGGARWPRVTQLCRSGSIVACFLVSVLMNYNETTQSLPWKNAWPAGVNIALNIILSPGAFSMGRFYNDHSDDDDGVLDRDTTIMWPRSDGYVFVYTNEDIGNFKRGVNWVNGKFWITYPAWLIGYYYGDKLVGYCRQLVPSAGMIRGNAVAAFSAFLAYAMIWLYGIAQITWLARGAPAPFAPHVNRIWTDEWPIETPNWIWLDSPGGNRNGLIHWNPKWARPFYIFVDTGMGFATASVMLVACVAVPWRAARCGNAALGKFVLMQVWPLGFYLWVLYLAKALGRTYSSSNVLVQVVQFVFIGGWPFFFVYMIGPMFTAVTVAVPRFLLWLLSLFTRRVTPMVAVAEIEEFSRAFPVDFVAWWGQYFYEIRRDTIVLAQCFADLVSALGKFPSYIVSMTYLAIKSPLTSLYPQAEDDPKTVEKRELLPKVAAGDYGSVDSRV